MEFTVQQIAQLLGGEIQGDAFLKINTLGKIQFAQPGQIAFLANPKYENFIYSTQASAVIVSREFKPKKKLDTTLIIVENPYSSFTRLLEEYHRLITLQKVGVEEPSFIGTDCQIGENIYRGAFSYIGSNVKLGNNVKIYPHAFIGDDCEIGNNTIIHPSVKLYSGTLIGNNCEIHAGTVIGSDGFGFAPQPDGSYKTIPQMGIVIIEDNVSIGANTVIDCATMLGDSTSIRAGVKLDNLIQIGHNVEVGKNTVIAAQTGISGSTKIGENCVIGGQVGFAGHLTIANKSSIGAQAGVLKSVKEENAQLFGTTALDVKDYFRSYVVFKKLPDLYSRFLKVESKLKKDE
jgi:UDP-3-O-[3-hydroxymyristoyl] glucosamine N-acyltransferase